MNKEIILSLFGNVVADYQRFQGKSYNQKKLELLTNPKCSYSDSCFLLICLLPWHVILCLLLLCLLLCNTSEINAACFHLCVIREYVSDGNSCVGLGNPGLLRRLFWIVERHIWLVSKKILIFEIKGLPCTFIVLWRSSFCLFIFIWYCTVGM